MRLKRDDDSTSIGDGPSSLQVGRDLARMVGVTVVDTNTARVALGLHPAVGARESLQPGANSANVNPSRSPMASAASASRT